MQNTTILNGELSGSRVDHLISEVQPKWIRDRTLRRQMLDFLRYRKSRSERADIVPMRRMDAKVSSE